MIISFDQFDRRNAKKDPVSYVKNVHREQQVLEICQ
jgi:hypothetical protein